MTTRTAPSGAQHEIRHGNAVATVVEVGGGLRDYRVGDRHVLEGYAADEMAVGGRGQHLMPWPNRIKDGAYTWDGHDIQAPLNDFPHRHAVHGLTRWLSWSPGERSESAITMHLTLHPSPGYPFSLDLAVRHELSADGLTVTPTATNIGAADAPFAYGCHPYLLSGSGELVDEDLLHLPADTALLPDDVGINTVRVPVEGSGVDFGSARPIGDTILDTTFTGLHRDADGLGRVRLRSASGDCGVTLWFDASFPWVQTFSGDTLQPATIRRRSLAVEPMTAPPNAFVTGEDVVRMRPGASWTGTWGITPG